MTEVQHVDVKDYHQDIQTLFNEGYEMMVDLTAVDWFRKKEPRFEVVVNLLSLSKNKRKTIKVKVDDKTLTVPSITDIYPGANFYEREVFDMFGILFENHPELTRILMPDDWIGYPLRKDYGSGRIPVQFKNAPKVDQSWLKIKKTQKIWNFGQQILKKVVGK